MVSCKCSLLRPLHQSSKVLTAVPRNTAIPASVYSFPSSSHWEKYRSRRSCSSSAVLNFAAVLCRCFPFSGFFAIALAAFRLLEPPPSRATAGRHIPLCGGAVSFSAFLTCLSPRNSVRTCALARVEGSVPPTSGFGDRRSPLSYTRICALLA